MNFKCFFGQHQWKVIGGEIFENGRSGGFDHTAVYLLCTKCGASQKRKFTVPLTGDEAISLIEGRPEEVSRKGGI